MRTLRLAGAAGAAIWMGAIAAPAHAAESPAVTGITVESQACAGVCFQVTVDNPVAGTITLRLTGHTPAGGDDWVDVGVAHVTLDVVAGKSTYDACFGDVSQLIADKGFNSLRIDIVSSTVPGLAGTTTKSASFTCSGGSGGGTGGGGGNGGGGGGGTGGGGSTGGGSGAGSSSTGSSTAATSLAETGGFDDRFLIAGLGAVAAGLALLALSARAARRRAGQT